MTKKPHDAGYAPWQCKECGAWVFTLPNLHFPLCSEYKKSPALVESARRYYETVALKDTEKTGLVKKTRKRRSAI